MNPTVAIAMIVKDEAAMAPAFLEAVRGLWDELVVVDTGSTDGTPALFRAAGANVVEVAWPDSFAEARNVSLARVTADWVLVLDADERVSPDFHREFSAQVRDPSLGALLVRMSNPLPYGHRREAWLLRAFRRDAALHFEHAIHEDVSRSVDAMLTRRGLRTGRVHAPIEHLGYIRSRAAAKDKKQRDATLLAACLADDPHDYYSHLKLLELARYWHDGTLWRRAAIEALGVLQAAAPGALARAPWGGELLALAVEGVFHPATPAGLELLDAWERRLVPAPAYFHHRARCHEALGHAPLARADFERCLALAGSPGDIQLTTVRPRLGLSRLAIAEGHLHAARDHAVLALGDHPRDPEALTAVAALTRHLEGGAGLEAWAGSHAAQVPHCPERDWAVGEAHYAAKDFAAAAVALRRAAGVPPAGAVAVRLAQALLAQGQFEAAEQLAHQLSPAEPEAGLGVLVFDLAIGRDSNLDLELTPDAAEASHAALGRRAAGHRRRRVDSPLRGPRAGRGRRLPLALGLPGPPHGLTALLLAVLLLVGLLALAALLECLALASSWAALAGPIE